MTLNSVLSQHQSVIGKNGNYLSYNLRTNTWKLEHFNCFEKIIRAVAIWLNAGEKYTNTRLNHVITYLDSNESDQLNSTMKALWQKTYPSTPCPLMDSDTNGYWKEIKGKLELYKDKLMPFVNDLRRADRKNILRITYVSSIYVLMGLKPLYVCSPNEAPLIRWFQRNFPHLRIVTHEQDTYLINENPLASFHPKKYIAGFSGTIEKAILYAFPHLGLKDTDQRLSYLLGFGPTWEAYAGRNQKKYKDEAQPSVFTDEHYLELGKVLNPLGDYHQQVEAGKNHHLHYKEHPYLPTKSGPPSTDEEKEMDKTYNHFIVDSISIKTPYLQQKIALQKRLLEYLQID